MTFDISSIQVQDTTDIEILNPSTGEPLVGEGGNAVTVTVYGPGTPQFAKARSQMQARNMKRARARGGRLDTTPEEDLAATASLLTAITVSFNHFGYKGMQTGPEMFRACYIDRKMGWLTKQIDDNAGDWANFTQAASGS